MAASDFPDELRVSNGEGWYGTFALTSGLAGDPPWLGLPEWTPGTAFDVRSACVYRRDLYVALPGLSPSQWTSAAFFAGDNDITGVPRWLLVGRADSWTQVPYDLTGATVEFAIKATDPSVTVLSEYAELSASSADPAGDILVSNATAGGVTLAISPDRTRSVPAGLYRYDIIVTFPDGRQERARYGLLTVDQGMI